MSHMKCHTDCWLCLCFIISLSMYQILSEQEWRSVFLTLRWVLYKPGSRVLPLSPWNFAWMRLCYGPAWTRGLEGMLVSICLKIALWKSLKEFGYPWIWRSWDTADVLVLISTHEAQSSVRVPQREAVTSPRGLKSFAFIVLSGLLFYAVPWMFFFGRAKIRL